MHIARLLGRGDTPAAEIDYWLPTETQYIAQHAPEKTAHIINDSEAHIELAKSEAYLETMRSGAYAESMKSGAYTESMSSGAYTESMSSEAYIESMDEQGWVVTKWSPRNP